MANSVTYMLSGGTGAVGLRVVQWMAEQGARHFILRVVVVSPLSGASELKELRSLQRFGVHVHIAKADVGNIADVKRSYDEARKKTKDKYASACQSQRDRDADAH